MSMVENYGPVNMATESACACREATPRMPPICDMAKKNTCVLADLECGIDTLLEILKGSSSGDSGKTREAKSLTDEVMIQSAMLNDLHQKLSEAISTLSGRCGD